LLGTDERAVKCVHGLTKLSPWAGDDVFNHTDVYVVAPIVAYSMLMNRVDHMDQCHSTLAMQRKDKCLHMTICTYLLDLAAFQVYALHQKVAAE
jgi:hypothetical protein